MPARELRASPVLVLERFSSFEEYRPNDAIGGGTSFPLHRDDFPVSRAALALPALRVVMQRSFARRLEGDMGAPGAALIVPLSSDGYAELNGGPMTGSTIALFRGVVPVRTFEPHSNMYAMLRFHSAMRNRGWPEFEEGFELLQTPGDTIHRLRSVLFGIVGRASSCSDARQFAKLADAMQNDLLAACDRALVNGHDVRPPGTAFGRYQRLVARLDELVQGSPATPLYVDVLANNLDVSARTLRTAVGVVHGTSLHRYLQLRRLWSVRCSLSEGPAGLSVKAAALANGFWHLGDFSRNYRAVFGERPSDTLARGRGG